MLTFLAVTVIGLGYLVAYSLLAINPRDDE